VTVEGVEAQVAGERHPLTRVDDEVQTPKPPRDHIERLCVGDDQRGMRLASRGERLLDADMDLSPSPSA
jgi:hypothetical protein